MDTRTRHFATGLALLAATIVGCGDPNQATVQGKVTLDGSPLSTGMILFIPSQPGAQAYASIEETGQYEVFTGRDEGLLPGEYRVTVVSRGKSETDKTELGGPVPPGASITPRWYASAETSGLVFDVKPGSNTIDLALTSQPPPGWKDSTTAPR